MNIPIKHLHDITSFKPLSPLQRLVLILIDQSYQDSRKEGISGSLIPNTALGKALGISATAVGNQILRLNKEGFLEDIGVVPSTNIRRRRVVLPEEHISEQAALRETGDHDRLVLSYQQSTCISPLKSKQ